MTYMNKKVKYIEDSRENFTYITPHSIITTNKQITKELKHKLQN